MTTSSALDHYRLLGRSGLRVSPLSLGTMTFGSDWGWGADDAEAQRIFDAYVERGGNFIDTADSYSAWVPGNPGGVSESIIGEWLAARGRRNDLVLATKVCGRSANDWFRDDGSPTRLTRAQIFEAVGISQDLIDAYFCNTPSRISGIGITEIARENAMRHHKAYEGGDKLERGDFYQYHKGGQPHIIDPETVRLLQKAVKTNNYKSIR